MTDVRFTVEGKPTTQGSKKAFVNPRTGRAVVVEQMGKALREWRRAVQADAEAARRLYVPDGFSGPVAVEIDVRFERPKKPTYMYPRANGDVDKLARACLDSLTDSRLFVDDADVVDLHVRKSYGFPVGVTITVRDVP